MRKLFAIGCVLQLVTSSVILGAPDSVGLARESNNKLEVTGVFDALVGYSSNAASSPGETEFAGFILDDRAATSASTLFGFGSNIRLRYSPEPNENFDGNASASCRKYPSAGFVDECRLNARVGATLARAHSVYAIAVSGSQTWLGGARNRTYIGVTGSMTFAVRPRWNFILEGAAGSLDYTEERFRVLSVRRLITSVGFSGRDLKPKNTAIGVFVIAKFDEPKNGLSTFGNFGYGFRVAVEQPINTRLRVFGEASALHTDYDGHFGFFFQDRIEDAVNLNAGLLWTTKKDWVVTSQLRYTNTSSTISLFSFRRLEVIFDLQKKLPTRKN